MDSLANYESENSNNSEDSKMAKGDKRSTDERRASDVNYDPVQMDMSEDSNNNNSSEDTESESNHTPPTTKPPTITNQVTTGKSEHSRTSRTSPSDQRRSDSQSSSCRGESQKPEKSERARASDEKCRRSSNDERRHRDSDHKDSRRSRDDDKRSSRDEERRRNSSSKDDKKEERDKDHHHRDERREHRRDRDRRHSRSDRVKDRHRDERSSHAKEKDRPRSRSRSKDRSATSFRSMSYRDEKNRNKLAQLEKLGIELKAPEGATTAQSAFGEKNFYNPLATAMHGKYAEQIQKRKLLWANKSKQEDGTSNPGVGSTNNTWVGTTFTHDQDGKMSAKFKRLMGIKGEQPVTQVSGQKPDILKKQEEMFNNMEQQYEVARATTHTQRGVGLGYASSGYQFPR